MSSPALSDLLKFAQKLGLSAKIQQSIARIWKLPETNQTALLTILLRAKTTKERNEKAHSAALQKQFQKFEAELSRFTRTHTGLIRKARERDSQTQESSVLEHLEQSFQAL